MNSSNFLSLWSLLKKEIFRFLKVGTQTIIGPAVSSLLFLAIFVLALGSSIEDIHNIPFANFIAPGLIMMTILQNSFSNPASSIGQAKFQGNIVDVLMAPLGDFELTIGYLGGSIARGLVCGFVTTLGIAIFIEIQVFSFIALFFYAVMGSLMMGALGIMVGIWADKWDQQEGITNFIILPMTFLSGTFYSITKLPEFWQKLAHFNPFFYNIDGFRYAFTGYSDSSLIYGSSVLIIINLILIFLCYLMFRSGYKLKS
ncbi:MAG: Inner membrane transport permease YadH [Alphaproteobacteria bacterium MarineAlpha5_Bin6]|nr:MAG: Inner membrane transport permease YadH [Alphaproteobacteria bacterium MarineAlpha5_Bin7]PPR54232.1 MAG: Inner membrane transport permease YadH [Alphaproteobacteria bacterium MarineAlpha5_Bin6]|tara:strand:+ start:1622 stop:2392 length:771 start_codon:yes stop_codon:yes gene_type:complete